MYRNVLGTWREVMNVNQGACDDFNYSRDFQTYNTWNKDLLRLPIQRLQNFKVLQLQWGKNVEYSTSEHKARNITSKVQEKAQIVLHRYTSHHVRIFSICLLY